MKHLIHWMPLGEPGELHPRLGAFGLGSGRESNAGGNHAGEWTPPVNIWEDDRRYYLEAELPGVEKENVKVTLENQQITVSGERFFVATGDKYRHHLAERTFGRFRRAFTLPEDIDGNSVGATFTNGLLLVEIPKSEGARPREIPIKAD